MEAQRLQVCKNKVVKTIFKLEGEKKGKMQKIMY